MYSRMLKHFLSFHLVSFIICCPLLYEGLYKQSYMLIIQVINVLFLFILARQKGIISLYLISGYTGFNWHTINNVAEMVISMF